MRLKKSMTQIHVEEEYERATYGIGFHVKTIDSY